MASQIGAGFLNSDQRQQKIHSVWSGCGFGLDDFLDCLEQGAGGDLAVKFENKNSFGNTQTMRISFKKKKKKSTRITRLRLLSEEKFELELGGHVLTFHSQFV